MTGKGKIGVKPIRNERDHEEAKARIEELMVDISNGKTGFADELEILAALVEAYERKIFPVRSISPIDAIKFRLSQKGLAQKDLEPFIGSRSRVSDVLAGTRKLSPDMMRALHEGLGIPYEALMQKGSLSGIKGLEVKKPVIKRLRELGFEVSANDVESFIRGAFGDKVSPALNRRTRTQRASGRTDDSALLMWQAAVLCEARRRRKVSIDQVSLSEELLRSVSKLSLQPEGPELAIDNLSNVGVIVVIVPVLPGTFLDGAAMLLDGQYPVIGMTLRHDRTDNFWFTLLHELSHLLLHNDVLRTPGQAFFDELELDADDDLERQADGMALMSLIPDHCVAPLQNVYASNDDIMSVSRCAGVHPAIVAGRWQKEHDNFKKFSRLIERNTLRDLLK